MAYITVLHVCVKAIIILSAFFLCQPLKFNNFFHLLAIVSSLFVLSDVIVEDIVSLCTCTCTYKKAIIQLFLLWYV